MSLKVIITNVITDVISNVINLLFTPIDVSGLTFWTKAKILARSGWPTTTAQLKNEVGAPHLQLNTGSGIQLVSATSDQVIFGNVGTVKAIEFWMKLGSTTEKVIDLNGTANIEVVTGTITLNNWAGATIKVNDVVSSTLDTNWKHVLISSSTGISASAFKVGNIASSFGDFAMKDLIAYSAEKATSNYNTPQAIGSVTDALIIARFSETKYLDNGIAINEGTGGNATVLTTGVASYDMAVNGLPDGFQLGLSGYNRLPFFSGADVDTEQVSLGTAITLDFTTGFRVDFKILTNSYGQNGVVGKATQDGFFFASNDSIIIYGNAGSELVNFAFTAISTNQLYLMSLRCNGTTLSLFADGALIGSQSRGALTTSEIENIARARGREGQGFIFDVKINDVDNSDSFTHDYSGINGDWSDQIGTNDGTAGATLTYRKLSSLTPEGLTDYFNNTIQKRWKTGTINLGDYGHLGAQIGSTNGAIDGDNRSFVFLIDYANNGAVQRLLSNRIGGDGVEIYITGADKLFILNEVGGALLNTDVAADVSEVKNRVLVTLASNGDCVAYIETLGTTFNSTYTSKNLGAPGGGSDQPKLGIKSDDTDPFTSPINYIQVNSVIDLATANKLADYMEIQFSKI